MVSKELGVNSLEDQMLMWRAMKEKMEMDASIREKMSSTFWQHLIPSWAK